MTAAMPPSLHRRGEQGLISTSTHHWGYGSSSVVCRSAPARLWRGRMGDNDYVTGGGARF